MRGRRLWKELWATGPGRAGLLLFAALAVLSIYVVIAYPLDFGPKRWSNPSYWADNPKNAPPVWASVFLRGSQVKHQVFTLYEPTERVASGDAQDQIFSQSFDYRADHTPTFLSFSLSNARFQQRSPTISVTLHRPDGRDVTLFRDVAPGPRPGETAPYERFVTAPLRVVLDADPTSVRAIQDFLLNAFDLDVTVQQAQDVAKAALFGTPRYGDPLAFVPLQGTYRLEARVTLQDAADSVGPLRYVVGGDVYGLTGTDGLGRDLTQGLLFGLPIALFIGLATAVVSTVVGASLGIISGYTGGVTDGIIQRGCDLISNVPVLPLLIFLVIISPSQYRLLLTMGVLVAFSWPGLTILLRSMVLQLRSSQEVEAAKAMGASRWRIMLRHIFPHTAPFVLAQMIFFPPSAILAEAALSFLGLGDPTLPTWGQILEQGFRTGAVYLGYWWWIVPPGLAIVVTAVTFMLIALGLEPVLNPRLRKT